MARARNIKPGFFKNETLAECSPLVRLLFAGLWCLADREGRLEDPPKRIRAEILPYDDGSVDDMLDELHEAGFIPRYHVGNERFIQVLNFTKHQNPHCREPVSTIPAPGEHSACTVQESGEHRTGPADSLNPSTTSSPAGDPLACPVEAIVALYHELMPANPRVKVLNDARRKVIPRALEASRQARLPAVRIQQPRRRHSRLASLLCDVRRIDIPHRPRNLSAREAAISRRHRFPHVAERLREVP